MLDVLRLLTAVVVALLAGKLISRLRLPSILGWLMTGMILGPHALGLLNSSVLDSEWFHVLESILECTAGLMIGTELIWNQLKKAGKQIIVTTITESVGTFLVVSVVFGIIFWISRIPVYLAFLFGGIALATAPAPSLSIVSDMKTAGPVTSTLIPMAALDDLVGAIIFFSVIAAVAANISTKEIPIFAMLFLVFLPVLIGMATGFVTGKMLQKAHTQKSSLLIVIGMILVSSGIGLVLNEMVLKTSVLNFMLLGMGFSTIFANMISQEQLGEIMKAMHPVIGMSLIVVILNLGAPLDYHLIFNAGIYTLIYIVFRAIGKYCGAYFEASITHAPQTVKNIWALPWFRIRAYH